MDAGTVVSVHDRDRRGWVNDKFMALDKPRETLGYGCIRRFGASSGTRAFPHVIRRSSTLGDFVIAYKLCRD